MTVLSPQRKYFPETSSLSFGKITPVVLKVQSHYLLGVSETLSEGPWSQHYFHKNTKALFIYLFIYLFI